jgi:undecaprenyl-diphosphatase
MSLIQAIIMGVVQGLTEFLPVSSSGHLAIFRSLLKLDLDTGILFEIMLHFGTLLAIFAVYYKDIIQLIVEGLGIVKDFIINLFKMAGALFTNKKADLVKVIHTPYRKFVMLIIVGSIPTGIFGLYLEDKIEAYFSHLIVPGIALLITGSLLLFSDRINRGNKKEEGTTYGNGFIIGVFQGIAIIPGISRSGSTIVGGLLNGLNREFAIKFSFILSIPAVLAATLLQFLRISGESIGNVITAPYLIGTAISAIVGYICIKTLILLLRNNKFHLFAYYCFGVGILTIIGSFFN